MTDKISLIEKDGYSAERLGGGTYVIQKDGLYKFTSDALLLSKFAAFKSGDAVADFCSGSGVVGFNFYDINKNIKSVTFFEMQKQLYELSLMSIELNGLKNFTAVNCRVQDIASEYNGKFSLILCNPPYEKANSGAVSSDDSIAACRSEITVSLKEIIASAAVRLKFGGRLAMLGRADRLAEIIYEMKSKNIEPKRLQFVCGGKKSEPYLVMIEGNLGGKSGIRIFKSVVN